MINGETSTDEVSAIDPCSVCGDRVKRNSVLCVRCRLWVHKRCSGVKDSLTKVDGVFERKTCVNGRDDGSEAEEKMDEGLEKVENFVYFGDCISAAGGCRRAVTARVRAGWKKLRDLSGILCGKGWTLRLKGKPRGKNFESLL